MKPPEITIWILAGLGVASILYLIQQQTGGAIPVPEAQAEWQFAGLGIQSQLGVAAGTPLDTAWENHGWHPGHDPVPMTQPVVTAHRYPAVPGGNLSNVMHHGWDSCIHMAPNGEKDWFMTPPEAAIL